MLTIHVWPRWLKAFLLAHDLYKSPKLLSNQQPVISVQLDADSLPAAALPAADY